MTTKVASFPGNEKKPDYLMREQLAAQAIAVLDAHFSRPDVQELLEILHCAELQIRGRIGG